ncbi:glycerophosphodiester phosphodiesterase [Kitasatospora paracochleata]|uniref:Glycerophosphoryl diester phosphodiesterase n=1 Tax=Kitasatospora paracochleata TaxID=58354 RepID=A0ABT1J6F7_9ACTN|nr:glycerophosphodiester phosphodiesterase [Kitasatospora paracochleata]MCP2313020.1 glycerophosphoryl diester phosphodiesterase [Kitasatospora paracochleata]
MDTQPLPAAAGQPPLDRSAVKVIAHRGSSAALPEHTAEAYRRAIEEGADGLECDVRLTADGQLVCVHDRTVRRTSDGRGTVSAMTLAQLSELDFGSWKSPEDPRPASVLTLAQLLELVADAGRRVELAIETKHPTRYAGRTEAELLRLLDRYGLLPKEGSEDPAGSPVRIMSFSELSLHRVRRAAPGLPTVYLLERRLPVLGRTRALPGGARIAGPGIELVRRDPGLVAALRRAGHRVHVWTVDEPADVELCLELGVEALITNRPAQVLAQLGR